MYHTVPASQVAWLGGVVNSTRSNKYLNRSSNNFFSLFKTEAIIFTTHHKFLIILRGCWYMLFVVQVVLMDQPLLRR